MLVILSGVAGAGKNTIQKELIKRIENVIAIPSFTDREIRPGDVPGETYNFVSTEEFERMIADGELYEYDIHHNHYYGTSKKVLNDKMKDGKIIVKDIDVNGTENLVNLLKNDTKVITIFLRVPKEELRKRLENRIDKPSPKEIQLRLNRFDYEESKIGSYDYVLKNNDLEKTLQIITAIIKSEENLENPEF
ncbi:MAG TPA: AAA family ATPase [Candidatus Merdicola faecigallinarum]|uniref:AAA family ATPase n=1 Tax=Candidatus Merdicola faecigallinarum TaxID=2840862 RepID=A0A9D1S8R5_9FIRM|nr:AAA family ATPase [Candidatus Merdicola faecigallinarum]